LSLADALRFLGALVVDAYGALEPLDRTQVSYVPGCAELDYTLTDLTVEGSSFTVEPHPTVPHALKFKAIAPGVSTVRVTVHAATEDKTVSVTLTAGEVGHVGVYGECDSLGLSVQVGRTNYFPNGARENINSFLVAADGGPLVGYDYDGEIFEGVTRELAGLPFQFVTSPTALAVDVRVLVDPASSFHQALYSSADLFDGLLVVGQQPANFLVGDRVSVRALPTIDGGVPCGYLTVESQVTSLTPEVCVTGVEQPDGGLVDAVAVSPHQYVRVVATDAGECRVLARRGSAEREFDLHVRRGWVPAATVPPGVTLHAVGGTSASNVYLAAHERVVDAGLPYPWPDAGVEPCTYGPVPCGDLEAAVFQFDGTGLTRLAVPPVAGMVTALWSSGPADVFAVGWFGTILHFDGSAWKRMNSGTDVQLFAIAGTGPTDVLVTGEGGLLLHYDGSSWSPRPSFSTDAVRTLWFASPTSGLASDLGTIFRWDGATWSAEKTLDGGWVSQLNGSGPDDVWAFGAQVLHFDGGTWAGSRLPADAQCGSQGWSAGRDDVFAFWRDELCHFDGVDWTRLSAPRGGPAGAPTPVGAMWSADAGAVFALSSTQLWQLIRD
jgi:hypothetical protein